jgi:hypothetical protein
MQIASCQQNEDAIVPLIESSCSRSHETSQTRTLNTHNSAVNTGDGRHSITSTPYISNRLTQRRQHADDVVMVNAFISPGTIPGKLDHESMHPQSANPPGNRSSDRHIPTGFMYNDDGRHMSNETTGVSSHMKLHRDSIIDSIIGWKRRRKPNQPLSASRIGSLHLNVESCGLPRKSPKTLIRIRHFVRTAVQRIGCSKCLFQLKHCCRFCCNGIIGCLNRW